MTTPHSNRTPIALIREKSPYLLQHAHNPVNWMPWSEEAFAKAKAENKPVFLSIGYSTCHWCHVMAHESFEDQEVADLLNANYVPIKVDREERPDIDHIYMTVCQELTGQGGWPLTVFLTPDKKPFYVGTYFPKRQKWGRPGLIETLTQLTNYWDNDREKVLASSEKVTEHIQPHFLSHKKGFLSEETLQKAYSQFKDTYDHTYGGFGESPKFPTPHNYLFLLREYKRTGDTKALEMVETTLKAMHTGGIYDHLGYGFSRYSVDERWLVPHFEKMLYDNALLAYAYLETYQVTQNAYYARVAREIFHYVERVMTSPEGGFYSAEDADSEGVEGKFYVWTVEEITDVLGEEDAELFCAVYDVTPNGNFEGNSILNLIQRDVREIGRIYGLTVEQLEEKIAPMRQKLFAAREERVHPHKDDKVLTAWNGLMIAALAKGAAVLQEPHYLDTAQRAMQMIETHLVNDKGRLLARFRDGEANFLGYLDDYAFIVWALHELYMASGDVDFLERATTWIDQAIDLFWDEQSDGFFFYGTDAEQLIARPKEIYDGALPSGNSVMAFNLIRHSRLTGQEKAGACAERQLQAFSESINHYPAGFSFFLLALQLAVGKSQEIVLAEGDDVEAFGEMVSKVQQAHLPFAVYVLTGKDTQDRLAAVSPAHQGKGPLDGKSAAYVCENFACRQPVTDAQALEEMLK